MSSVFPSLGPALESRAVSKTQIDCPSVKELWSALDEEALERFRAAITRLDLTEVLFALEGAEECRQARAIASLDEWAQRVARLCDGTDDVERQLEVLRQVLCDELDFQGDNEDYYHPKNSDLVKVIERRRGLPILLSAIWIIVGQRAGLCIEGVGMPGHFIVRVGGREGALIDPFRGGCRLEVEDCQELLEHLSCGALSWRDTYLEPCSLSTLMERVLRNLICSHERRHEVLKLYRCVRFMCDLCEDDPDPQILHAHLAEAIGAPGFAACCYKEIVERFPGTEQAQVSRERLEELSEEPCWLN